MSHVVYRIAKTMHERISSATANRSMANISEYLQATAYTMQSVQTIKMYVLFSKSMRVVSFHSVTSKMFNTGL